MLFTQRYHRALEKGVISVEIPEAARRKVWSWLSANNASMGVQRDPNDNWISNSSVLEETEGELLVEHGWQNIPGARQEHDQDYHFAIRQLIQHGDGSLVFDTIEIAGRMMGAPENETLRQKVNQIFEQHDCPWRLSDGEFFKLDADFVGARLAADAHDNLAANQFVGAADEFAKARENLAAGQVRDAIFYAGHSFESVMKVIARVDNASADALIKELSAQGLFDDPPEAARSGFRDQVLKSLPFLRNKLGGHGQGASVVAIPAVYGDLAIQLAVALQNFLIAKHLERSPPPPVVATPAAATIGLDDDIPF